MKSVKDQNKVMYTSLAQILLDVSKAKIEFGYLLFHLLTRHYGYSLKVILEKQAISNFDSQASWDMWQCQKS